MLVGAVDIGGSSVKYGILEIGADNLSLSFPARSIELPSRDFADLKKVVFSAVRDIRSTSRIEAVGISSTGSVDAQGVVVSAGHFRDYKNVSWSEVLLAEFPELQRVWTTNDGRASAWAEYRGGSCTGRSLIHAVVGTRSWRGNRS